MSALYIGLALLLAIALGLCVLAFRSRRVDDDDQQRHRAAQRDFYQQRQRELQADADMGLIDDQQLSELRAELDKQLLEENSEFSGARRPPSILAVDRLAGAVGVGICRAVSRTGLSSGAGAARPAAKAVYQRAASAGRYRGL